MFELILSILILIYTLYYCTITENVTFSLPFNLLIMFLALSPNGSIKKLMFIILEVMVDLIIINIQLLFWLGIGYLTYLFLFNK